MQVVDRAVAVLIAVVGGERRLEEVTTATGLPQSTAYRLLAALRHHGLVETDGERGFMIGPWVRELGAIAQCDVLARTAADITELLCSRTGFSAQMYRPSGAFRECVAAANPFSGLRDVVSTGMRFPLGDDASSHVLMAWHARPGTSGAGGGSGGVGGAGGSGGARPTGDAADAGGAGDAGAAEGDRTPGGR